MEASEWAAIASAIAACAAAIAAFLLYLIQRATLLESVRPDLVLAGWDRKFVGEGNSEHEVLGFREIGNFGRGAAKDIHIKLEGGRRNPPTASLTPRTFPVIAPGHIETIDGQITFWWENVQHTEGGKHIWLKLVILCRDSKNQCHETNYQLYIEESRGDLDGIASPDSIAPGVILRGGTHRHHQRPISPR